MKRSRVRGFTLLEILITLVIMAFGLLGLVTLAASLNVVEMDSYQRGQAVVLLADMANRVSGNGNNAAAYVTAAPVGTGDGEPALGACAGTLQQRDMCEWSNALKGVSEVVGGANVGAMIAARGCVEEIQAPNPAIGVCLPGIYRVTVAWQGLNDSAAPTLTCGQNMYSSEASRRAIASMITIGLPTCLAVAP